MPYTKSVDMRSEVLKAVKMSMLDLLGCNAVWTCRWTPTFRRNTVPLSAEFMTNIDFYGNVYMLLLGQKLNIHDRISKSITK
jgi:hypothetical protein